MSEPCLHYLIAHRPEQNLAATLCDIAASEYTNHSVVVAGSHLDGYPQRGFLGALGIVCLEQDGPEEECWQSAFTEASPTAEVVVFLRSGTRLSPRYASSVIKGLCETPEVGGCYTLVTLHTPEYSCYLLRAPYERTAWLSTPTQPLPVALWAEKVLDCGGLDTSMGCFCLAELLLRLTHRSVVTLLPDFLAEVQDVSLPQEDILPVWKRVIDKLKLGVRNVR